MTQAPDRGDPQRASVIRRVAFGALLISFAPVFVKGVDETVLGPTAIAFHRVAIGAVVLALAARVRGETLAIGRPLLGFAMLAGVLFAGDLWTWHRSILGVGAGMSTILANTQVVWVSIFGVVVLGELGGRRLVVGVALALAGVVLLSGVLAPSGMKTADPEGFGYGLLTGLFYASYILVLRRAPAKGRTPGPAALMTWVSAFCAGALLVLCVIEGVSLAVSGAQTILCLLGLAVVVQGLGWVVLSTALPKVPAAVAALVLLLQPTLATVWGILLFGEPLQILEICGAVLVLAGIYLGAARERTRVEESAKG